MLTEIRFQNFKCFEELHLPLGQLTLLTGLNSSGKSTVLQSMLLLRQSFLQQALPNKTVLLNGPLVNLGTAREVLCRNAGKDDLIRIEIKTELNDYVWTFRYGNREDDFLKVSDVQDSGPCLPLFGQGFKYVSAERLGPRGFHEQSSYHVKQQHQLGPDGRYAVAYLDEYSRETVTPQMHHPLAKGGDLRNEVSAWLGEVSPRVHLNTTAISGLNATRLEFGFANEPVESSPPNVGFGLSYCLPVLIATLSARPSDLIIIENPEAHLHPRAQVVLGDLMCKAASTGAQVFVETHSDHFLNGVRLATKSGVLDWDKIAIHFFNSRVESGELIHEVQSPTIDKDGRLDKWPCGFFDEWERSLDRLLDL